MATALAGGFVKAGLVRAENVVGSDVSKEAAKLFAAATGARTVLNNSEVASAAQVLFAAVKPDQIANVLGEVSSKLTKDHLLISIAAGITLARLETAAGPGIRVIRVMPNVIAPSRVPPARMCAPSLPDS